MAVMITIPNPNGKGENLVLSEDEQIVLRINMTYTGGKAEEPITREMLLYIHGEVRADGNYNDMVHLVVKP